MFAQKRGGFKVGQDVCKKKAWIGVSAKRVLSVALVFIVRFEVVLGLLALAVVKDNDFVDAENSKSSGNLAGKTSLEFGCQSTIKYIR